MTLIVGVISRKSITNHLLRFIVIHDFTLIDSIVVLFAHIYCFRLTFCYVIGFINHQIARIDTLIILIDTIFFRNLLLFL
jgi:hypothetical protein